MFTTLSKKVHSYNKFFEYTDIDDESLKILHDLHIEEHYEKKRKHEFIKMPDDLHLEKYYSRMPGKWCINLDRQIAFLELEFQWYFWLLFYGRLRFFVWCGRKMVS